MELKKLNCTSCGAPIQIPEDVEYLNCASCGSFLQVQHGEGYWTIKVVKEIVHSIEASGKETQSAIREGTQVTREELRRLQLSQDEMQLNSIRAEIRALSRSASTAQTQKQLSDLRWQEYKTVDRIRTVHYSIAELSSTDITRI
jgi:hypothetical protein